MSERERLSDRIKSPSKSKLVRSQRIVLPQSNDTTSRTIPEDGEPLREVPPSIRSHTPGNLANKSGDRRKNSASREKEWEREKDRESRQRSHSTSTTKTTQSESSTPRLPPSQPNGILKKTTNTQQNNEDVATPLPSNVSQSATQAEITRPLALRATSAIAGKPISFTAPSSTSAGASKTRVAIQRPPRGPHTSAPPLPDPETAPDVEPAPASGMYWSRAPTSGAPHTALRAHTATLIGSNIYIFGGCDSKSCFNELYVLDGDVFYWSSPLVHGDIPLPLRAMTCTAVGKKLVVFGGGDGPAYYNDVYILDTVNFRWTRAKTNGTPPSKRRAHTACLYRNGIYVFGGGDGVRALNDVWRLDVSDVHKMSWKLISAPTSASSSSLEQDSKPKARGYHTANMVGSKLIVFGGSDGGECFRDVWVFDVESQIWKAVSIAISYPRLSHTATIVGSYLFVIGGHDGMEYSNEVLLLNLVTMQWDKRKIYGAPPSGRGYHGTVLHDSRLFVTGGFDGTTVFGDVYLLELAVHAYYSQISHFTIDV